MGFVDAWSVANRFMRSSTATGGFRSYTHGFMGRALMLKGSDKKQLNFLTGTEEENRRRGWKRAERRAAKSIGGKETIGSGNKGMKGDAWGGDPDAGQRIMLESKSTKNRSVSLKLDWLEKLAHEAHSSGQEPLLVLTFEAQKFGPAEWAVLPKHRLDELLELESQVKADPGP